jgi:dihydrolipoamide dehydrogenase
MKVACVEKETRLGGTCLRVGCIPSKALLQSSEKFWEAREEFASHGIKSVGLELDLAAMMRRKEQIVSMLTKGVEALFKKNRITRYAGEGTFEGPRLVSLRGDAGPRELVARRLLIATGSKPATLPGVEIDGNRVGTSTEALSYSEVPPHLVVIGAGYIGLELGSVWRRLGSRVTVLEYLDRILLGMDAQIAAEARKLFEKQGIEFRLNCKVTGVSASAERCEVRIAGSDTIACDRVLVAVGRKPNTEGLGLERLGIKSTPRGFIPVNQRFETAVEGVYAIGDVIGGAMLAHKAEEEGVACAEQIATGHGHVNYDAIPGVVYTHPEIASVGKTEEQLKESGVDYAQGVFPFRASGRARSLGSVDGFIKVLAEIKTDRLLGVHMLGSNVGELINEAAAAISFGASSEDLGRVCHAHPTLGEALKEAALAVTGRAIHA